jgi:hypothetical protein
MYTIASDEVVISPRKSVVTIRLRNFTRSISAIAALNGSLLKVQGLRDPRARAVIAERGDGPQKKIAFPVLDGLHHSSLSSATAARVHPAQYARTAIAAGRTDSTTREGAEPRSPRDASGTNTHGSLCRTSRPRPHTSTCRLQCSGRGRQKSPGHRCGE